MRRSRGGLTGWRESAAGVRVPIKPQVGMIVIAGLRNRGEDMTITEDQVNAAQQAWCDALIEIGKIHQAGGNVRAAALALIDGLYDYAEGVVFFKPTMAHGKQTFRDTAKGALSYFVGGDPDFPDDKGFALKPWARRVLREQRGRKRHPNSRKYRDHHG